ncbi:MAG TPA: histidine kinase [Mycobacteriales bacterium]|nr:histidine kinase [Mycobacteriales bacterium]
MSEDPDCEASPWGIFMTVGRTQSGPLRGILTHGVSLIVALQTLSHLGPLSGADRALAVALLVPLVGLWTLIVARHQGDLIDQAALTAVVGLGAGLNVLTPNAGQVYVVSYAALFVAPFFYGPRDGAVPAAAGVVAVTFSTMFVGHFDLVGGLGNGAGAAFFGVAAMFWGRVLRASERNAELVGELQESRQAEQRNAVAAERARLARELHDVLAHTLSSLSLHLESTRVLAVSRGVDDEVVERIARAVGLAHTGLVEARDAVGTLRDDVLPGPGQLAGLVQDFERTSGIRSRFEQRGDPVPLPPDAQVALYRGAQEALTNVAKHAAASQVDVCLSWYDGRVTLRVADDGDGCGAGAELPGGGNGLRGMRERAELAGGAVEAGAAETGFVVELRLPRE